MHNGMAGCVANLFKKLATENGCKKGKTIFLTLCSCSLMDIYDSCRNLKQHCWIQPGGQDIHSNVDCHVAF
jgi:hypothetical protein